jgi:O-antigen/teichoic acid export membrane protein
MASFQVLVSGGVLFLLYRYLLQEIGPDKVGIWAIVLATASASKISELGFTGSAVKFTARYIARDERNVASGIIQTTVLTIGVILACILAVGYPLVVWILRKIIPVENIQNALSILPFALVSVWIGGVAGVFSSGLDGCQRYDLRALVSIIAAIFLLCLSWILVPRFGLIGLAWAQIGQGVSMLIGSRVMLQRELPALPLLMYGWRYSLFREMFHYGVNFQIVSIFSMLFDPTTKALMAKFGGLSFTAYYEMANRMVMQFRSLLITANQVIVPRIATLYEKAPEAVQYTYKESYRIVFFLALPLYAGVAAAAPLVSELWIGNYEPSFARYSMMLAAGFCFNTLVGPAYFVNLGTGELRWNTISHVVIGILNGILGYLLGSVFGGEGVVLGYLLALVIGSSLVVLGYHYDYHIPLAELLPNESKKLFLLCCVGSLVGWIAFNLLGNFEDILAKAVLSLALTTIIIGPACWIHPMRTRIMDRMIGADKKRE